MTWRHFQHYWPFVEGIPGGYFNIKMPSYQYRKSHCGDKTILGSSYLRNGISNTGKISFLYWVKALVTNGFPSQRASTVELWCFLWWYLNKLLNKQLSSWWFHVLWCFCHVTAIITTEQNGWQFSDIIIKCIPLNGNCYIRCVKDQK